MRRDGVRDREGVKKCWGQPAAAKWFTDKQGLGTCRLWQSPIFSCLPNHALSRIIAPAIAPAAQMLMSPSLALRRTIS